MINIHKSNGTNGCRLLYLVGELGPGGLERQLCYLLQELDRERYRPAVAVWNYQENDIHVSKIRALGVSLYPLAPGSSSWVKLASFCRLVHRLRPEVVHSYTFYTNFAAYFSSLGTGAIAFGSLRSELLFAFKSCGPILGTLSGAFPRKQIWNSMAAAHSASISRNLLMAGRRWIVTNGLDLQRFPNTPIQDGLAHVVGVGYLLPIKRWDRLLRAAAELKNSGYDFRVTIAGSGEMREDLEKDCRRLCIDDRVSFPGHVEDIPNLLKSATFVVHSSDSEGRPNAVMEAMACGRAVIATAVGDIPSIIDDGITGFLVGPGDSATMVKRMAQLLGDRRLCRQMGARARAKAEREFGLQKLVSGVLAAYRAAGWIEKHA